MGSNIIKSLRDIMNRHVRREAKKELQKEVVKLEAKIRDYDRD